MAKQYMQITCFSFMEIYLAWNASPEFCAPFMYSMVFQSGGRILQPATLQPWLSVNDLPLVPVSNSVCHITAPNFLIPQWKIHMALTFLYINMRFNIPGHSSAEASLKGTLNGHITMLLMPFPFHFSEFYPHWQIIPIHRIACDEMPLILYAWGSRSLVMNLLHIQIF